MRAYKTLLTIYDLHLRRDPQNATTFGELASSHAVIGNLREAVLFHREAAALHVPHSLSYTAFCVPHTALDPLHRRYPCYPRP